MEEKYNNMPVEKIWRVLLNKYNPKHISKYNTYKNSIEEELRNIHGIDRLVYEDYLYVLNKTVKCKQCNSGYCLLHNIEKNNHFYKCEDARCDTSHIPLCKAGSFCDHTCKYRHINKYENKEDYNNRLLTLKIRKSIPCKDGDMCNKKCHYDHTGIVCKFHPDCKNGNMCRYIHQ